MRAVLASINRLFGNDGPAILPLRGWSAPLTTLTALAMGFLAVLTLSVGIAAGRLAETWQADLASIATVSVTTSPDQMAETLDQSLDVLRTTPGIGEVRAMSDAEHAALLEPWLGSSAVLDALPTPRLIEVQLIEGGPDIRRLQLRLDQTAPGARFDDHQNWRGPLARAATALRGLAWAATTLVALAAAGMIGLSAQATLAGNIEVVRVVRLIGAAENFITRAFVYRIALRALAGAAAGALLALGAMALMPTLGSNIAVGLELTPGLTVGMMLAISVPLVAMAVALLASSLAIRFELRRMT